MQLRTLIISAGVLLSTLIGRAQSVYPIVPANRVLHNFDFEERQLGNDESIPMYWQKVIGDGLFGYVNGQLTTDSHRSGQYSFRIDLDGGSCIYRYGAGRLPVTLGSHYRVLGYCRTTALPHARARLSACLADATGHLLESTRSNSKLFAETPDQSDTWQPLVLQLTDHNPAATSLVVEMQLLQPALYGNLPNQPTVPLQDIHGSAWFDDISVCDIPQLRISTGHIANIFVAGTQPALMLTINDQSIGDLNEQLVLSNADGIPVYQRTASLTSLAPKNIGPNQNRVTVALPMLGAGWYDAKVILTAGNVELARQHASLVQLADDGSTARVDERFGVDATAVPSTAWPQLPLALGALGVGRVKLAVNGSIQSDDFDRLLDQLRKQHVSTTGCLVAPPTSSPSDAPAADWSNAAMASDWQPALDTLIARQATRIDRWQLGRDGWDGFAVNPTMRLVFNQVYTQFSNLIENPNLLVPWPAWSDVEKPYLHRASMFIPTSILPAQIPLYLHGGPIGNQPISVNLAPISRMNYGRKQQLADYAKRFILCLAGRAPSINVPVPLMIQHDEKTVQIEPTRLFPALRTLTQLLGHCAYQGQVPVGNDIDAYLFDRHGQAVLALWSKGEVSTVHSLSINLGQRPLRVDLMGNRTPLLRAYPGKSGDTKLDVGPMPIFLIDIDAEIARLRASVGFDQPLMESSFEPHNRHFRFTNPYPQTITGMLRFNPPRGWTIDPPSISFSVAPGETFDHVVTIQFPYNSVAGKKTVGVQFSLQADRNSSFTVPAKLMLGLSDVGTESMAYRNHGDCVVQQIISNYGEKPINYTAFAQFPGHMRINRLVLNLQPGQSVVKRYRVHDPYMPAGTLVRLGLKEFEGSRVLNEAVELK